MKTMSIEKAVELIKRDHGGCDQNTCTISVALRTGYALVAIDAWISSGAASEEFDGVTLPFGFNEVSEETTEMSAGVDHVDCPHCNSVIWLPDEVDHWCDSCGKRAAS